jgi:hypothetical protein
LAADIEQRLRLVRYVMPRGHRRNARRVRHGEAAARYADLSVLLASARVGHVLRVKIVLLMLCFALRLIVHVCAFAVERSWRNDTVGTFGFSFFMKQVSCSRIFFVAGLKIQAATANFSCSLLDRPAIYSCLALRWPAFGDRRGSSSRAAAAST